MNVHWTPRAAAALEHIHRFIAKENPAAAKRTVALIHQALPTIKEFPYSGRAGTLGGTREWVVSKTPYIIVYRMHDHAIEILHILHGAQKWPEI